MIHPVKNCCFLLAVFMLALPAQVVAESVLEIPRGTEFTLRYELEIPANRNFILLGSDKLDTAFNGTGQLFNEQDGRWLGDVGGIKPLPDLNRYLTFEGYLAEEFNSVETSYRECLERHRVFLPLPGQGGDTTIIQQGQGNVAIIQQKAGQPDAYLSKIENNSCTPPQHTFAALVVDAETADGGGFFAKDYVFKVRGISRKQVGIFNVVKIFFDHDILDGLMVVTTRDPATIPISALQSQSGGSSGFWSSLGSALVDLKDIGGNAFDIKLPEKRYFK